jgi:LuxR family transcriptional regulator, maltose regulon positive regulatory protein
MAGRSTAGAAGRALPPVVSTKLAVPRLPETMVRRERLDDRLSQGVSRGVVLVSAEAGAGKTLAVSDWARSARTRMPICWVSVEAHDDAGQFWSLVLASLRAQGAVPPDNPLVELRPGPRPDAAFLSRVIEGIAALPSPVVLVLDDLHDVDSRAVLDGLALLIRHRPAQLRLVLVSRFDPPLPLHRLRLAGELTELRSADLAFTREEASHLLAQHDVEAADASVDLLVSRTSGWAVGLRLAALSLRRRDDVGAAVARFAGDDRAVAEYLADEVLAHLPPETRRFLQLTCVPDRICGELADALTGDEGGQARLDELVRRNAFVVALDDEQGWYRYHPLLADLLRHQLHTGSPATAADMHRRCAQWSSRHGDQLTALRHAVAAQDWTLVGRLAVERFGPMFLGVDAPALVALALRVPAAEAARDARLATLAAMVQFALNDPAAMHRWTATAREHLDELSPEERQPAEAVLLLTETAAARIADDVDAVLALGDQAVRALDRLRPDAVPLLDHYRAAVLATLGGMLLWSGRPDEADRALEVALRLHEGPSGPMDETSALAVNSYAALADAFRGRLTCAQYRANRTITVAEQAGWPMHRLTAGAHLALAITSFHRGEADAASASLARAEAALRTAGDRPFALCLALVRARLALFSGQIGLARASLDEAVAQASAWSPPAFLARSLRLVETELAVATDQPEVALAAAPEPRDDELPAAQERMLRARVLLRTGDPAAARDLLAPLDAPQVPATQRVEALVLLSLAADALRQDAASLDAMCRAVELAEPQQVRRPFLQDGDRLRRLLARHARLSNVRGDFLASLLREAAPAGVRLPTQRRSLPFSLAEPLSDREQAVLYLLPTLLSNGDIATELHVSVNTVKTHLKSLYRKLGVESRRDAVRVADQFGLLSFVGPAR